MPSSGQSGVAAPGPAPPDPLAVPLPTAPPAGPPFVPPAAPPLPSPDVKAGWPPQPTKPATKRTTTPVDIFPIWTSAVNNVAICVPNCAPRFSDRFPCNDAEIDAVRAHNSETALTPASWVGRPRRSMPCWLRPGGKRCSVSSRSCALQAKPIRYRCIRLSLFPQTARTG
jgi:hypothetical protein